MTFICAICGRDLRGKEMWNPPDTDDVVCTYSFNCELRRKAAQDKAKEESNKCQHEWSGVAETTGMRVCLKCKESGWPHRASDSSKGAK